MSQSAAPMTGAMPVPLTVIGGFLGAGKTTLLNRVLAGNTGVRYAVMVNDFGDLAIDDALIRAHDGDTISFANGCVCCTLGDNFIAAIDTVLERPEPPEQILIEASGVADPRAIADIAELHPLLQRDLTLVLADAGNIQDRAADERLTETVARQLTAADLIILNKCDLVDADRRAELQTWLQQQSPAPLVQSQQADLPLALLRGTVGSRTTAATAAAAGHNHRPEHEHAHEPEHEHEHDHGDIFAAATVTLPDPLDPTALRQLLAALPATVLRVKGFVLLAGTPQGNLARRNLLQWSGGTANIHPAGDDPGSAARPLDQVAPALVVIGTADMPSPADLQQRFNQARKE